MPGPDLSVHLSSQSYVFRSAKTNEILACCHHTIEATLKQQHCIMAASFLDSSGYHRPRRPDPDTITYLRGLPLQSHEAHEEVQRFLNGNHNNNDDHYGDGDDHDETTSFPQSLAAAISALDEIRGEVASLAGDEFGSQSLEVLARIAVPHSETAARVLLSGCCGYLLHLATHRYGSHVLQTLLQLAVLQDDSDNHGLVDLALHEDAPGFSSAATDSLPSLSELILSAVEELAPHASQLAVHVCGSHVLRTLLCVLGGVDLVAGPKGGKNPNDTTTMRGRAKPKKKKKRKHTEHESDNHAIPHAGTMTVVYRKTSRVDPNDFATTLESLAFSLLDDATSSDGSPGELQQLACHASAGPLLIVLVRVLTYATDSARQEWMEKEETAATGDDKNNGAIADFRLGIARPEPHYEPGSLADRAVRRILCWQDDKSDTDQEHVGDVVYGLSGEPRGSHVLETILRLCPDDKYASIIRYGDFLTPSSLQDYVAHDVSNFVVQTLLSTVRGKEQAEAVLKVVEGVISNGVAVDAGKKRRAVLWRATELAAKYRIYQKEILEAIRFGFVDASKLDGDSEDGNDQGEASKSNEKKHPKTSGASSSIKLKDCAPLLIDMKEDSVLDAAGCRSLYHMLRFSPKLCEEVLNGIINEMPAESLLLIAKDGLGSRCIMDGILDGPILTPIFAQATKQLREKLEGHWTSLASDRVGHHTVKKLFKALPKIDDKAKLVDELYNGGNRLRGNAMGRSVTEACHVELYGENRAAWRKKIVKSLTEQEENFLDEMTSKPVNDTDGDPAKKKRKRQRKRSGKSTDDRDECALGKGNKVPSVEPSSVDSIMKLMTAGQ